LKKPINIDVDVNRQIEGARRTPDETANAILRRLLGIDAPRVTLPRQRHPRSSGAYSIMMGAVAVEANSLKELLRRAILVGEKSAPGLIGRLAGTPTTKGRFIVARTAAELYPRSPQLAEYAERLNETWWFDTNVARRQVQSYLAIIADLMALDNFPPIHKRTEKTAITPQDLGL
jgi:hypothetical protein